MFTDTLVQPVALLGFYGGPGCSDSWLSLFFLTMPTEWVQVRSGQVRSVAWPMTRSNTVNKALLSSFGTVSTGKVLLEKEIKDMQDILNFN